MTHDRVRAYYRKLLALYPQAFQERLGESMEQTFNDLRREHIANGGEVFSFVLRTFTEMSVGIISEHVFVIFYSPKSQTTMLAKVVYVSFVLIGVAILAFAFVGQSSHQSLLLSFGGLWLALSIVGSLLDARFGHSKSQI